MNRLQAEIIGKETEVSQAKCRIEFTNPTLKAKFDKFLEVNKEAPKGTWNYLGIFRIEGANYYSTLEPFDLLWKITREFEQVAEGTCQFGDIALVDKKTHKAKTDNPLKYNGAGDFMKCWFNANISTRVSDYSQAF